jgi:hypothetical protein
MAHANAPDVVIGRELLHVAHEVRSRVLIEERRLELRDVYLLCFHIARELQGQHSDQRIMVGDRIGEHGKVQHHWLELPGSGIFLDPAYDDLDPFHPVRIGRTSDEDFHLTYINGLNSEFNVDDARDRPEMVYRPRTAFDPEHGTE